MKNCKDPNNGGNVLISKEGKLILIDQSANEISSVDLPDISTKLDVSAAEAEYAHSLSLDGTMLKLMNHKDSPEVLSSVDLPTAGGRKHSCTCRFVRSKRYECGTCIDNSGIYCRWHKSRSSANGR